MDLIELARDPALPVANGEIAGEEDERERSLQRSNALPTRRKETS